ncbi:hypothetical protein LOK49_LG06G01614 [Camellia lanceoleosa]|uniref:Uncharacterized protein n=1 Tax=Camellia lanceoleosa TaxID=1840588 RepID=A0ACC0HJC9_9ERIC|nr:hypothetical protein LOK49_LG06G01614 [Camellia lanceoleosa]
MMTHRRAFVGSSGLIYASDSGQGLCSVSIPHVKLRIWAHDIKSPCDPLDGERSRLTIPHAVLCREGARVLWSYVDRILGQPSLAAQFEIRQLNLKGARLILGNAIGKAPKDKDLISGKAIVTLVFDRLLEEKHVASKAIESSSSGVVKLDMDSSRNPESGEDRRVIAPQEACNQIAEVVQEALKKMEMVADEKMRMFKKAHQALEASELELDEKAREVAELNQDQSKEFKKTQMKVDMKDIGHQWNQLPENERGKYIEMGRGRSRTKKGAAKSVEVVAVTMSSLSSVIRGSETQGTENCKTSQWLRSPFMNFDPKGDVGLLCVLDNETKKLSNTLSIIHVVFDDADQRRSDNLVICAKWKTLPEALHHVPGLRSLSISGYQELTSLPEWSGNLMSLQSLCIWDCLKIPSLLHSFQSLTKLQTLSICGCSPELARRC